MAAFIALIASCAIAQPNAGFADATGRAAGGQDRAWILYQTIEDEPRTLLFYLSAGGEPGQLRTAGALPAYPRAIASRRGALVVAFGPGPREPGPAPTRLREYDVTVLRGGTEGVGLPGAVAPIAAQRTLYDLAGASSGLFALVAEDGQTKLLELASGAWQETALPAVLSEVPAGALTLIEDRGQIAIAEQRGTNVELWTRTEESAPQGGDDWSSRVLTLPADSATLIAAGDELLAWYAEESGDSSDAVVVRPWGQSWAEVTRVAGVPRGAQLFVVGERIVAAWPAGPTSLELELRVVTQSGEELFAGLGSVRGPVSPQDIHALVLVMAALVVLVAIFLLRPEHKASVPVMPDGFALASPGKRLLATIFDLAPGIALSRIIWDSAGTVGAILTSNTGEAGPWPLAVIMMVTILQGTAGEALAGRSLGKTLMRCRTIDYTGQHPSLWIAFCRNTVKILMPPVAGFAAMNPDVRMPASFDTLVVQSIDDPADRPPAGPQPGPPKDQPRDEG